MTKLVKTSIYKGIKIYHYHGSPPRYPYMAARNFYMVRAIRKSDHFDTLEDAKRAISKYTSKEQTRDLRVMRARGHKPIKRKRR